MIIKKENNKFDVLLDVAGKQRNVGEFLDEKSAIEAYRKAFFNLNGVNPVKDPDFYEWKEVLTYKLIKIK